MNKILNLQGIGEIKMVRNKRAKRLSVAVSPISGIRVTVPHCVSFGYAEKFVSDKKVWIRKNLDKPIECCRMNKVGETPHFFNLI